jgi:cell division protein FtsI (penicillin-binding protein 3)
MKFDHKRIIPRYTFVIILLTLVGVAVIVSAGYSMFFEKDYWEKIRERLASRQKDIPAVRGNIYSADGQLLVGSMPIYTLYADLVVVDRNDSVAERKHRMHRDEVFPAKIDSISVGLNRLFPKKSVKEYKDLLHKALRNARLRETSKAKCQRTFVLARNASYIQYREFLKLPYVNLGRNKSGFYGEEIPQRQKPYGNMATRTLGSLLSSCDSAMNGLELAYDSILRGVNGKMHREKVRKQWTDRTDVEPINGLDIISTIDVGMQDAAEKMIVRKLQEVNGEVGVVVLMEVATGDVKAIANMTRLGTPGNYYYAEVKNNAITDLWEPGSTFKTASIMVALEDGMVTRKDSVQVGNGQYLMHGRVMKDHNWRRGGYGRRISVDECLMFSSNVGVSRIIDEHYFKHPEKYVDGLYREGVGVPFTLPFQGQGFPRVRRPKADGSNWSKTALAWMSIGYETQIPPIYTLTFYNAIANNGRMVKPRFVREIQKDGVTLKEFPVEVVKEHICKPSTLKDIHEILERVVNDKTGLGKKAGCKQFKVCGKTGTAQVADEHGSYHGSPARYMVSFCGFYPSESPKYSCIVCIKKSGLPASGGGQCGPVFSELAQYVMAKGVFRNAEEAADSTSVFEMPDAVEMPELQEGVMPDVTGLGARDAVAALESLGLKVRLVGRGLVQKQNIAAGAHLTDGQTVTLSLSDK